MTVSRVATALVLACVLVNPDLAGAANGSQTSAGPEIPAMGDYPEGEFRDAAAELAPEVIEAVNRDLGLSAEEYLAQAAAAADASDIVEYLADEGVEVGDSRLDGTTLTIAVDSEAEAALVEAAGAVAVVGSLPAPFVPGDDVILESTTDVYGGDVIVWQFGTGGFARCSVGVNGTDSSFESQLVTAGHCTASPLGNGGLYQHLVVAAPGFSPTGPAADIGVPRANSFRFGSGYDVGLVRITQSGFTPQPTVSTFSGAQGARAGGLISVRDTIIPITGSSVCKSGATTGWTCGKITNAKVLDQQVSGYKVDVFLTDVCMLGGDSGGPAMVGNAFVGVNSGSGFGNPQGYTGTPLEFCAESANKVSAMAIMRHDEGVRTIATLYGTSWEPTVLVDRPATVLPATYQSGSALTVSGAITNANPRTRIEVTVNGAVSTVKPNVTTGSWSANVGTVSGSTAQVHVQARWGLRSTSERTTFTAISGGEWVERELTVQRIAGADRYDVAIAIAQRGYPISADFPARPSTVYVVNGGDFPDALGAGSAAAATGGLVMLVPTDSLLPKMRTELQRLRPQKIIIVGGPASVSESVRSSLQAAVPTATVSRLSGANRFDVSLNVMNHVLATNGPRAFADSTNLYVANGFNYPDALVAGAAGASSASFRGISPVLTVAGPESSLPLSTRTAIANFGFSTIMIAGGPGSVSPGIQAQLTTIAGPSPNTLRLGGATRFDAARSVANDAYRGTADTVFLTTGFNFPDALAGAPLAGLLDAPMFSVETTCVPQGVLADLARLQPTTIILLGGTGTLTPAVAALTPCPSS